MSRIRTTILDGSVYGLASLLLVFTLGGCSDDANSIADWGVEEPDGSIQYASLELPASDEYEAIGATQDSSQTQPSADRCFGDRAVREPDQAIVRDHSGGTHRFSQTPDQIAEQINLHVPERFHISETSSQLGLPFMERGESYATVRTYQSVENAAVEPNVDSNVEGNYASDACGSEQSPISLSDFTARCGDAYTSETVYGAFSFVIAVHPTWSEEQVSDLTDRFNRTDRGGLLSSAENLETLVDLGFEIRVYTYGLPSSVVEREHGPGAALSAEEAMAYSVGTGAVSESTSVAINEDWAWPHDGFGDVLRQSEAPYRQISVAKCTGLGHVDEVRCYTNAASIGVRSMTRWRGYLEAAEQRLQNPGQYDWGYDRDGLIEDHRVFAQDVSGCLQRSQGLLETCRAQVDATPDDATQICDACAPRFSCEASASNSEQCAGAPGRERAECRPGAFSRQWERISDRVRPIQ